MENHSTEDCPSLPGLQAVFKQGNDPVALPLQPMQQRSWQQIPQAPQKSMPSQYSPYNTYSPQWNSPMPWKPWPNTTMQTPPWKQGWRGYNQGNMPPKSYPTYSQ